MVHEQKYVPAKELFDLNGKAAIVTGGASGIGFGCAKRLAESEASVVIADVNAEMGKQATQKLTSAGYKVAFVKCDVRQESDVTNLVETTVRTFGGLDIMLNDAGIYPLNPITEFDTETWDRIMDINMKGTAFGCVKASQQMIKQGRGGSIINIASVSAVYPTSGLSAYDASKGGVKMLTRTLALELAPYNIRVNSVSPGTIHTEGTSGPDFLEYNQRRLYRVALGRMGTPDDIARVVLFLASPASSYVTGSDIVVDGGITLTTLRP